MPSSDLIGGGVLGELNTTHFLDITFLNTLYYYVNPISCFLSVLIVFLPETNACPSCVGLVSLRNEDSVPFFRHVRIIAKSDY